MYSIIRLLSSLVFCFVLLGSVNAQYSQVRVSALLDASTSNSQKIKVQSKDGMATCEVDLNFSGAIAKMALLKINFNACSSVLKNLSGVEVFENVEKSEDGFIYADNSKMAVKLSYASGNLIMNKIISKKIDLKYVWMFDYDLKGNSGVSTNENSNKISSSKIINEPTNSTKPKSNFETNYNYYKVVEGDYVYKIARNTGCSPVYILKQNNINESTILYPGQTLIICNESNYTMASSSNSKSVKSDFNSKKIDDLGNNVAGIKKKYDALFSENTSLKTYGEELKADYEELVNEYQTLKKSYEGLAQEYKGMADDNKKLQAENERLKQLLKERNVDPENALTEEEKLKVDALKNQISSVRSELQEMKNEIDNARAYGNDSELQEFSPTVTDDSEFKKICSNIIRRSGKDADMKRLVVETELNYKLSDLKVTEIRAKETNVDEKTKLKGDKKSSDYVTSEDIFNLMSLDYNFTDASSEELDVLFYVDLDKTTYKVKISDSKMKFKSSSKDNLDDLGSDNPHVKLIRKTYEDVGSEKGKYDVVIIDSQFNLEPIVSSAKFKTLKKYSNSEVVLFSK